MNTPILKVENLKVSFPVEHSLWKHGTKRLIALDDVSFELYSGETLGLVGESGCGKSTLAKAILNLLSFQNSDTQIEGAILLRQNQAWISLSKKTIRAYRSQIQIVFQDPFSSLNPRMRIFDLVREPLDIHEKKMSPQEKQTRVFTLLEKVGLSQEQAQRYPHEFSGGQRQRVGIARALACSPKILIADEPVSSLDISIQAQILNLLKDLQKELQLSCLFISHDLSVVRYVSDRIAVMSLGKIVECGSRDSIYANPQHPCTQRLIASHPRITEKLVSLE
jgi:ABC-type oligopeptide transport system ATPase subunit